MYYAGKDMVESGLYSFGVVGTAESRAQWALQTSAAAVQGIARLWNEPRAVFNEWRSDFMENDPMKIRQASAQATGVGLGVVSGLRATRSLAVKMAEMPGPVAGSRAAQLGGVKIGGDGPSREVTSGTSSIDNTARAVLSLEDALVLQGDASRARIVQTIGEAAQPSVKALFALDPEARVGFRGSLANGLKNDTKLGPNGERVPFDGIVATKNGKTYTGPQGYDADFFVVRVANKTFQRSAGR